MSKSTECLKSLHLHQQLCSFFHSTFLLFFGLSLICLIQGFVCALHLHLKRESHWKLMLTVANSMMRHRKIETCRKKCQKIRLINLQKNDFFNVVQDLLHPSSGVLSAVHISLALLTAEYVNSHLGGLHTKHVPTKQAYCRKKPTDSQGECAVE